MRRVMWMAAVAAVVVPTALSGQSWKTVTMSRQLEDSEEIRVSVEYGAGAFTVRSIDEGLLYRMNLRYDEDKFEPVADFSGTRLHLGVETIGRGVSLKGREAGELELELARGVPMDLDLEFGAVKADIDLGGLALTDLDLSTGASESYVDVSEPNPLEIGTATFEAGAAAVRPDVEVLASFVGNWDDVAAATRDRDALAFSTSLRSLPELEAFGQDPSALIFHMSCCGSTLL